MLSLSDLPFTAQLCNTERDAGKQPSPGGNSMSSTATSAPRALRASRSFALRGEIANPSETLQGFQRNFSCQLTALGYHASPSQACPTAKDFLKAKNKNQSQLKATRRVLHSFRFLFKQIHCFPPQQINLKKRTDLIHVQMRPFPAPLCSQHRDHFCGMFDAPCAGAVPAASPGSPPSST